MNPTSAGSPLRGMTIQFRFHVLRRSGLCFCQRVKWHPSQKVSSCLPYDTATSFSSGVPYIWGGCRSKVTLMEVEGSLPSAWWCRPFDYPTTISISWPQLVVSWAAPGHAEHCSWECIYLLFINSNLIISMYSVDIITIYLNKDEWQVFTSYHCTTVPKYPDRGAAILRFCT